MCIVLHTQAFINGLTPWIKSKTSQKQNLKTKTSAIAKIARNTSQLNVGWKITINVVLAASLGATVLKRSKLSQVLVIFSIAINLVNAGEPESIAVQDLSISSGKSNYSAYSKRHIAELYEFSDRKVRILSQCNKRPVWAIYYTKGHPAYFGAYGNKSKLQTNYCRLIHPAYYESIYSDGVRISYTKGYLYPPKYQLGPNDGFLNKGSINTYPLSLILKLGALLYTEDLERYYIEKGGELLIITGTIENDDKNNIQEKIETPDYVFKIMILKESNGYAYQAWLFPNNGTPTRSRVDEYLTNIADLKRMVKWPLPQELSHYLTPHQQATPPKPWLFKRG